MSWSAAVGAGRTGDRLAQGRRDPRGLGVGRQDTGHAELAQPVRGRVVPGLDQAHHGHPGGSEPGHRVAVQPAQLGRQQHGLRRPGAGRGQQVGDVHAPADDGDPVVGAVQGTDQLGLPGRAGDSGEDLQRHQPVGPAVVGDGCGGGHGGRGAGAVRAVPDDDDQRATAHGAEHVGHVVGGQADHDLDRGGAGGQHPLAAARDGLHRRPAHHQVHLARDVGRPGRRVGDGVDVDHLTAGESRRGEPGLHRQRELHLVRRRVQRRPRHELPRQDGATQHRTGRVGRGGQVAPGDVVEPDGDGDQVLGLQHGAGGQVTGRGPDRDGGVGRGDHPGAEQHRAQHQQDPEHQAQVQPPGRADPARHGAGRHGGAVVRDRRRRAPAHPAPVRRGRTRSGTTRCR